MASFARPATIALALLTAAACAPPLAAQQADEGCSGTLCDFYYSTHPRPTPGAPATAAAPAGTVPQGATPVTVPQVKTLSDMFGWGGGGQTATAQQPAAAPRGPTPGAEPGQVRTGIGPVGIQGGGIVGALSGAPAQRCTGTLCDFFYGGAPPEPEPAAPAAAAVPRQRVADDGDEPAPRPTRHRSVEAEKPRCASPASDPWRCYR